jgi:hypothetical protein
VSEKDMRSFGGWFSILVQAEVPALHNNTCKLAEDSSAIEVIRRDGM